MLDVSLIFKIAGIAVLIAVMDKVFDSAGKKEYAVIANIVGIIMILMLVINLLSSLFTTVRTMFQL